MVREYLYSFFKRHKCFSVACLLSLFIEHGLSIGAISLFILAIVGDEYRANIH